jgi:hypothetical protein
MAEFYLIEKAAIARKQMPEWNPPMYNITLQRRLPRGKSYARTGKHTNYWVTVRKSGKAQKMFDPGNKRRAALLVQHMEKDLTPDETGHAGVKGEITVQEEPTTTGNRVKTLGLAAVGTSLATVLGLL